jgi:hypothetical protein
MKPILAAIALLVLVSQTHAESRTVLVQVKQDKDKKASVTIRSDEPKEQKSAVSADDAAKVIGAMKGWGSKVGVYVASDRAVPRADLKKLLAAVNDNPWLDLEYFGREVPKVVADHFLKVAQGPKHRAQQPGEALELKVAKEQIPGGPRLAAPARDPEEAFRKACELVAALEGKHDLLKGVSRVRPAVQRDEQKRLKSADLAFANNTVPPGMNDAKAKDPSRPFFYVSVQVWSGRSLSPPGNLHEFEWHGQTYQMWVRVYGSDAELVKRVRKSIDEPLREPLPPRTPSPGKLPGSRSSLQAMAPLTTTVFAAVAKEEAEIQSRAAAHLSTQETLGNGEVIKGGGYVFFAQCRQQFQVLEILHGKDRQDKSGDRVLAYGFVEKTEGFPLPGCQEAILRGAKVLLLLGQNRQVVKALLDSPENRKALRAALAEQGAKKVEGEQAGLAHKAADVMLIATWLCGNDAAKAFAKPFGDSKFLTDGKDPLLYTDVAGVTAPAGLKAVNYEFAQARMQQIKRGHKAAPAVVIVRSSLDEPAADDLSRHKGTPGGRVYYVEVAIGNLAWHWLKVVVRDEGERPHATIRWHKVS